MVNVGKKPKKGMDEPCLISSDSVRYPYLSVDSEQFAGCKDMKVGKEHTMQIVVKPTRVSIDKDGRMDMSMDVIQMGMEEKDSEDSKMDKMVDKMYPAKKQS